MVSGFSTIFLPEIPHELCDRKNLIKQAKQVGNKSDIIDEELIAIAEKLIQHKYISVKQLKILLLKCLN